MMGKKAMALRERRLEDQAEVARAWAPGNARIRGFETRVIYSLSAGGNVRQTMVFQKSDGSETEGAGWNLKSIGTTVEDFIRHFEQLGFKTRVANKRVNYEKQAKVIGTRRREETEEERELAKRAQELRGAGNSYEKIEVALLGKSMKGFWAMKTLRGRPEGEFEGRKAE